jgi:hypothetical protein
MTDYGIQIDELIVEDLKQEKLQEKFFKSEVRDKIIIIAR